MRRPSMMLVCAACLAALFPAFSLRAETESSSYLWKKSAACDGDGTRRFAPPTGFHRTAVTSGSFADWLRHLPLKKAGTPVLLFDGTPKTNRGVQAAVVDIDTGARDLQQCADAVMRLRAEYLFSAGRSDAIRFHFTCGELALFSQWRAGFRPVFNGNRVQWVKKAAANASHAALREYLNAVFAYAGSLSLARELSARTKLEDLQIGDVFIRGGSPGHAVIVVDMAENPATLEKLFLLAQSYMPAQDIHILKNPSDADRSPWFSTRFGESLKTPEWTFRAGDLKFFP